MIKPEELRKNNLVRDIESGRIGPILTISEKRCSVKMEFSKLSQSYDEFEPIPLSEEWLLRFGFQKDDIVDEIDGKLFVIFTLNNSDYFIELWINEQIYRFTDDCNLNIALSSIHQLQNLFFSLTGEELTIKQSG